MLGLCIRHRGKLSTTQQNLVVSPRKRELIIFSLKPRDHKKWASVWKAGFRLSSMFKRLPFLFKFFFFLLFHKAPQFPQPTPQPSCKSVIQLHPTSPSFLLLHPSSLALYNPAQWGHAKISTPSLLLAFQRVISDHTKLGLCNLYSLRLFLATLPWPLLHGVAHFRLHKLYSPLLEFTCILSICTLPANAAQTHTSPTDMWSVTHNSSQHLSCFPKPKSKSSDETCCRVQTQSILKIKFCDQALFAEGNFSLATSEHSRISRQSQCYKNASVVWAHPIVSALLPQKWFS